MADDTRRLARRSVLVSIGAVALAPVTGRVVAAEPLVTVHKDPNCGCCSGWVQHLREAGFAVAVDDASDLDAVRRRLGIPPELRACHTAEMDGYLLEGHVPAVALRRLLAERPKARGLAVPGMPSGSPGMNGEPQPYTVMLFEADGHRPFMRFVGDKPIA